MYYLISFFTLMLSSIVLLYLLHRKKTVFLKMLLLSFVFASVSHIITGVVLSSVRKISILQIIAKLFSLNVRFMVKFTIAAFICQIMLLFLIYVLNLNYVFNLKKEAASECLPPNKKMFSSMLVYLYTSLIMIFVYLHLFFPALNLEQLLFTLSMPIVGTSAVIVVGFVLLILIIPISISCVNYFLIWNNVKCTVRLGKVSKKIFPIQIKYCKIVSALFVFIFVSSFMYKFELINFIKLALKEDASFYEEHYIDPGKIAFHFPTQKKNLILIYLESMEAEAASTANPGVNLIPELSQLAEDNISFSHTNGLGGQLQLSGTGWSMASLCCTHLGIPLTLPIGGNSYENTKHFFNGAYGLGDLLKDNGYTLSFAMGADAEFGGLRALLKTHGDFEIKDLYYYRNNGYVPQDYHVWWGIEDKKIIEFSKEELLKLGRGTTPFMFSVFLEDTHSPGGYMDKECEQKYVNQIHNVFSCTSKRVAQFVAWIKEQEFYTDTVIVLLGDHLYMGGDLYTQKKTHYERHAYNAFINTGKTAAFSKNRAFATFDFFPTIIEALGVEIEGGAGIGRSLFSDKPTLLEEYGEEKLNEFINSKSSFYRNELLNKTDRHLE